MKGKIRIIAIIAEAVVLLCVRLLPSAVRKV